MPYVKPYGVKCIMDRKNVDIELHGNYIMELGDVFDVFFMTVIADAIEEAIMLAMNVEVP